MTTTSAGMAALRQVLFLSTWSWNDRADPGPARSRLLLEGLISADLGLAAIDPRRQAFGGPDPRGRLASIRTLALARLTEWRALRPRGAGGGPYLDGHRALFPATIRDWAEQLERIVTLAGLAECLAELDGLYPFPPDDPDAFAARVDELSPIM